MECSFEQKVRQDLNEFPEILFAEVFGSYASGEETENSDVDISIAAYDVLPFETLQKIRAKLNDSLDRDIDLVDLNSVSGLILKEALTTGQIVMNKDPELYAGLMKRMLYNQADMMPYYNRTLEERREEFLNG